MTESRVGRNPHNLRLIVGPSRSSRRCTKVFSIRNSKGGPDKKVAGPRSSRKRFFFEARDLVNITKGKEYQAELAELQDELASRSLLPLLKKATAKKATAIIMIIIIIPLRYMGFEQVLRQE